MSNFIYFFWVFEYWNYQSIIGCSIKYSINRLLVPIPSLFSSIYKYWPISTKLGHNTYAHEGSDEFNYGSNWIRTSGVICPWLWKNCWIWLCLHSSIYKYWPVSTKLGQNVYYHKISDEFDYGTNQIRTSIVICPWIWKNSGIWLCSHSSIYKYWPIKAKLGQNVCDHKDEFGYGSNQTRTVRVNCPTPASANIDQSVPNLAIKSQMSSIIG